MRYIDNPDLRQWVLESLQRKLVQKAHELAVQTGCEVLLRLQDVRGPKMCKYYVTDGMKHDYFRYGVRADPDDLPMSGESGLPKKYVQDFTCQVACEATGPVPFTPDCAEPHDSEIIHVQEQQLQRNHHTLSEIDVHANDQFRMLCRERLWNPQMEGTKSKSQPLLHSQMERRWPGANGQRPYVYPARSAIYTDANEPTSTENHVISQLEDSDAALRSLKQLHFNRLAQFPIDKEVHANGFPRQQGPTNDRESFQILPHPEDQSEEPDIVRYVSHVEKSPIQSRPIGEPPRTPQQQQHQLDQRPSQEHDNRTGIQNGIGFDSKSLAPGNTQQRYLCRICERTFCDLYTLVSHAKMFHSNFPDLIFTCNTCKSGFENASSLHDHLQTHGDLGFLSGAACQLKVPIHDRQNIVQQRRFPCPECGKVFSRFGFMQSHIERVHGSARIASSVDTTALSNDTAFLPDDSVAKQPRHEIADEVIVVRNTSENWYRCVDCGDSFQNIESLQQHDKRCHLIPKTNSAPPTITENVEFPVQRLRSKSEDAAFIGKEIYTCQECGKQFTRGKLLQNHVNTCHIPANHQVASQREEQDEEDAADLAQSEEQNDATGAPKLVVKREVNQEILDLSTGNQEASDVPLSEDSNDTPPDFTCSSLGTPASEAKHSEGHDVADGGGLGARQKRYACDVCGKTYKYGFHMKEHRLTHAAVCPFVCRLCGMGFFRQRQLRDHELRHTGAYPCRCEICGKGFPRTSELKRHLAFRHRRVDVFARHKSAPSPSQEQT